MAHIQAGSPSEVLILDDVTTNLELPSFTLHLANILPLLAILDTVAVEHSPRRSYHRSYDDSNRTYHTYGLPKE